MLKVFCLKRHVREVFVLIPGNMCLAMSYFNLEEGVTYGHKATLGTYLVWLTKATEKK